MTAGIKDNVNPEGMTGIPLIEGTPIVSQTAHDRHMQTVVACRVDGSSVDYTTYGVLQAVDSHPNLRLSKHWAEIFRPDAQSVVGVRTGRTVQVN